jgi:O-antigen biosynthesis protein
VARGQGLEGEHKDELFPERFLPGQMHGLIEAEHLARYCWAGALVAGKRVLDAGCGTGYGSRLLLESGASSVVGVDIAQEAIDAASTQPADGLSFMLGDMLALPLPDASVEMVVCFEAIEHVQDQDRALDELRRVLTRDGWLAISSPNRDVYEEGNPYHTHEFTPDELRAALSQRFANVSLEHQQAWLTSMICDQRTLVDNEAGRPLSIEVRKVGAVKPGSETFIVALASDEPLPQPSSTAMLTNVDELSDWVERARSAEEHLARAQHDLRELEASHRSADTSYRSAADAYATIERAHRAVQAALEQAEAALEQTQAELDQTQAALDQSREEVSKKEHELNRSRTMLAERNATLRLATEQMRSLQEREQQLQAAVGESTSDLEKLTQSLSWRVTAPLRVLGRDRHTS